MHATSPKIGFSTQPLAPMTSLANSWQVSVQGAISDLEHLARHFTSLPRMIRRDEAGLGFVYECDAFARCTTPEEVLEAARQEFSVFSGVIKLARGSSEPLLCCGVYCRNAVGGREAFLRVHDAVHAHIADEPAPTFMEANGNVVNAQAVPPRTVVLANLAFSEPAVEKALRLTVQADSRSWVGLYRLFEVIEADIGGQTFLITRGWSTELALKRFKHSANSVSVGGDGARHGKEAGAPPKRPMSLAEASAYVDDIMKAWLAHKGA